jgi:hypothetical protein
MNNDKPLEAFQAAYDKATMELRMIHDEFERLAVRHDQVARVMEVLKPEIQMAEQQETARMSLTTRMAGLAVRTRLTVTGALPQA